MHEDTCAVEVEHLSAAYDKKLVLEDISLCIPAGTLMAIVGPNGAGKTTLLKAMLRLIPPVQGSVRLFGEGCIDQRKRPVAYVPQSDAVDWDFPATVRDVALMGCYGRLGWLRRPKKQDLDLTEQMLARVGMQEYAKRQISALSGGQQQRVFLARALVQQADIYFMDEPFKGVDAQTERAIVKLLKQLKDEGKTVVVVHHDLHTVREYFDRVALINRTLVANGTVEDVFTRENLIKTYRERADLQGDER